MRSNKIKMAYYGILMKDGTELTHYGVKGMKWGKRLFGKVKGVFGKPTASKGLTKDKIYKIDESRSNEWENKPNNKNWAMDKQRGNQINRATQMLSARYSASSGSSNAQYVDAHNRSAKKWANSIKRNSKRINGR